MFNAKPEELKDRRASDKTVQYEKTATNPQTGQKIGLRNGQWELVK
jgi:hypothetical protein